MTANDTNTSGDDTLALRALVWALVEPERALRLLDLTGLTPRDLRTTAGDPATLIAALQFLENHEPDLIECAVFLDCTPADLVAARMRLERA